MRYRRLLLLGGGAAAALVAVAVPMVDAARAPATGGAMAAAANRFLASLTPEQKKDATFALEDAHRVEWFFVPIARKGVPLKKLTEAQRTLAHSFLKTGLSDLGYRKTSQIIELEKVLAEIEKNPAKRDPELYYLSVFGTPAVNGTWGWRAEGHHLSLSFTVVKGTMFATSPQFYGANPGEVRIDGPFKGRRVLKAEEELGRALVSSLDDKQRAQAVISPTAPADILTKNQPKVEPLEAKGIAASAMTPAQRKALRALLDEYAASMPAPLAQQRLAKVDAAGFDKILFAWAGGLGAGEGHYYRVQGPTFLVEYDNTQNDANHIHAVWRDFDGDFGRDLLREHYKTAHRQ